MGFSTGSVQVLTPAPHCPICDYPPPSLISANVGSGWKGARKSACCHLEGNQWPRAKIIEVTNAGTGLLPEQTVSESCRLHLPEDGTPTWTGSRRRCLGPPIRGLAERYGLQPHRRPKAST